MEIQAGVFETVPECEVNCAPNALFPLQFLFCSVNKSNSTRFKLVYKKKKKKRKKIPLFFSVSKQVYECYGNHLVGVEDLRVSQTD